MTRPDWCPADVWVAAAKVPGVGGGHEMQGYMQSVAENAAKAILAEREHIRSAVVGHIMTVVESLMEGRMTDSDLTEKDHVEMQAQIEALDVVADEIQSLTFGAGATHAN